MIHFLLETMFAVFCGIFLFYFTIYCDSTPSPNMTDNPICDEIKDNCDYLDMDDAVNITHSSDDLSIMQLNIRGLVGK